MNKIRISTDIECQGVFEKEIFISDELKFSPNPVIDDLHLVLPGTSSSVQLSIYHHNGSQLHSASYAVGASRMIRLPMATYAAGIYLIKVTGPTVNKTIKVQKQ